MSCFRGFLLLAGAALLSACVIHPSARPNDPSYAPAMPPTPAQQPATNGSLFRASGGLDLFSDRTARQVGDILTVVLQESTISRKSSNVGISKDSDTNIGEASVLGRAVTAGGYNLSANLGARREFSGEADADQSNNLRGNISVTVVNVWPNGTLEIRGEKWMTLNRGDEYIRITGLVRPDDVQPNNQILSTHVANARITYAGSGALADSQSMGWLSRFFNSAYWPF